MTNNRSVAAELEVDGLLFRSALPLHPRTSPNILIIEDDEDVRQGWTIFLRHQGYGVEQAADGLVGSRALENDDFDIVLLDLGLPGLHGLSLLREARQRGLGTPVIVVTATASPEMRRRAFRDGASAVMTKPVTPQQLVSVIEDLLPG